MNDLFYRQDPFYSRETLAVDEKTLVIVRQGFGIRNRSTIPLNKMALDFEVTERRLYVPSVVAMLMLLGMIVVLRWFVDRHLAPGSLVVGLASVPTVVLLWHVVHDLRPVEVSLFRDRIGREVVAIYKPRKQVWVYSEFVSSLSDRIRAKNRI